MYVGMYIGMYVGVYVCMHVCMYYNSVCSCGLCTSSSIAVEHAESLLYSQVWMSWVGSKSSTAPIQEWCRYERVA